MLFGFQYRTRNCQDISIHTPHKRSHKCNPFLYFFLFTHIASCLLLFSISMLLLLLLRESNAIERICLRSCGFLRFSYSTGHQRRIYIHMCNVVQPMACTFVLLAGVFNGETGVYVWVSVCVVFVYMPKDGHRLNSSEMNFFFGLRLILSFSFPFSLLFYSLFPSSLSWNACVSVSHLILYFFSTSHYIYFSLFGHRTLAA